MTPIMKHQNSQEVARLKRRLSAAEKVNKQVQAAMKALQKVPSFKGKAGYMDRILRLHAHTHNLAWELERDFSDAKKPTT